MLDLIAAQNPQSCDIMQTSFRQFRGAAVAQLAEL